MAEWDYSGLPLRHYRCFSIDPPWKFSAGTKGRPQHYPRMTDAEIARMPLAQFAHPEGAFFHLWVTSPLTERFWLNIYPSWRKQGIRFSARAYVWLKTLASIEETLFLYRNGFHTSTGFTTRKNAEDVLLFRIGKPQRLSRSVREIIVSPIREHSRKPDEYFRRVETFCAGPRLEIFAREARPGWDTSGNETTKFDAPIESPEMAEV